MGVVESFGKMSKMGRREEGGTDGKEQVGRRKKEYQCRPDRGTE
jgi:hypothetical protein